MQIAVVHGYLLRGTGSNLYVSNLCRELCRAGHQVSLFCQESRPDENDFVVRGEEFSEDNISTTTIFEKETPFPGECVFYKPNLGGLLPVYVYDNYPGYTVKELTDLSEEDIERYLAANTAALRTVFAKNPPELILSQHSIMQPIYAARARRKADIQNKSRHLMTVHGSALNFSVRKSKLLRDYALEGIGDADGIVFVSNHSINEFTEFFDDLPEVGKKCRVIPAGVNTEIFNPLNNSEEKKERIAGLVEVLNQSNDSEGGGLTEVKRESFRNKIKEARNAGEIKKLMQEFSDGNDIWKRDDDAAERLAAIDWEKEKVILFYGKYMFTKGIHLIIGAAPLILREFPETRFVFVGYGTARAYMEALVSLLEEKNIELALKMLNEPSSFNPADAEITGSFTKGLSDELKDSLPDPMGDNNNNTSAFDGKISGRFIFTGIMNHSQLNQMIPCADICLFPSVFPEAFGMVGVEALSCGVLPLQTYHSGFADVTDVYKKEFAPEYEKANQKTLYADEELSINIARNAINFLRYYEDINEKKRADIRKRAHNLAEEKYAWHSIAAKFTEKQF